MALLTLSDAHLAFGHVALLDGAAFALDPGERLALIGRNGAGKSSLLRIVAGIDRPDDGLLQLTQGLRICYVAQEPQFAAGASVFDIVSEGVAEAKALRAAYEAHEPGVDLDALQSRIEALGAWTWEQRVQTTLAQLHLDGERCAGELSGGTLKRVALAQALVALPDVLLLDEPTNHLDLESIAWLEELLRDFAGALMLVTHDRAFLDYIAFLYQVSIVLSGHSIVLGLIMILFVSLFVNYFGLNVHKNQKLAYISLVMILFTLLHIVTYYEGGVRNSGTFYLAGLILAAYMLLGNKGGKAMAAISVVHVAFFY